MWYYNIKTDPTVLVVQDGPHAFDFEAREVFGEERGIWWERAQVAYPSYAEYQARTSRQIPTFVARRRA
jgi:deazaflavin-dependent oxidoreductase (nitroreductase family)